MAKGSDLKNSTLKTKGAVLTIGQVPSVCTSLLLNFTIPYLQSLPGIGKTMSMIQVVEALNNVFTNPNVKIHFVNTLITKAKQFNHTIDAKILSMLSDKVKTMNNISEIKFIVKLYDISGGTLSERELGGIMMPKGEDDAHVIPHPFVKQIIDEYSNADAKTFIIPLVFIDEIDRCFRSVQNELTTILLARKINGVELPASTLFIAAGNANSGYDEQFNVIELNPVVLNRLRPIYINYSSNDFLKYASEKGLNEFVTAFVTQSTKPLFQIDENDGTVECNPRLLEDVANILDSVGVFMDNDNIVLSEHQRTVLSMYGQLGVDITTYISGFSISREYTIEKVLKGDYASSSLELPPVARIVLLNKILKYFKTNTKPITQQQIDNVVKYLQNQNQEYDLATRLKKLILNSNTQDVDKEIVKKNVNAFGQFITKFAASVTSGTIISM